MSFRSDDDQSLALFLEGKAQEPNTNEQLCELFVRRLFGLYATAIETGNLDESLAGDVELEVIALREALHARGIPPENAERYTDAVVKLANDGLTTPPDQLPELLVSRLARAKRTLLG